MSNISPNTGVPVSSSASMGIKMTPTDWLLGKKQNYEQCIQLGLEFLGTDADFVHLEPKDRLFLAIQYANGLCQQLNNAELEKTLVRLDHSTRRDQYGESANQTTKATVARLSPLYDILRIKSDKSPTLDQVNKEFKMKAGKESKDVEDSDSGKDVLGQDDRSESSTRKI